MIIIKSAFRTVNSITHNVRQTFNPVSLKLNGVRYRDLASDVLIAGDFYTKEGNPKVRRVYKCNIKASDLFASLGVDRA